MWALSRLWKMLCFIFITPVCWCVVLSLWALFFYMLARWLVGPFYILLARYLPNWAATIITYYAFLLGFVFVFHLVFSLVVLCGGDKYFEQPLPRSFYSLFK